MPSGIQTRSQYTYCIDESMTRCSCTLALGRFSVNDLLFISLDFQNYLRTQTGNTTTINIIICTVDYLLRLQVRMWPSRCDLGWRLWGHDWSQHPLTPCGPPRSPSATFTGTTPARMLLRSRARGTFPRPCRWLNRCSTASPSTSR